MRQLNGGTGTRATHSLLRRFFLPLTVLALPLAVGCARSTGSDFDASKVHVALQPAESTGRPAYVAVTGLGPHDLSNLTSARPTDADWEALLRVTVSDETATPAPPAIVGAYATTGGAVTFTPRFPFDPGRAYRVVFDPSRLPHPNGSAALVAAVVNLPAIAASPTTVVTVVHPTEDVVPENLLRMYLEFSAPMGGRPAGEFVRLFDRTSGKDEEVEGPFLPVEANFWSPDYKRYTLLLDPGRVKLGILPNRQRGRPLRAGHKYALEISPNWTDANRQPLKSGYRHEFAAGPAEKEGLDMSQWKIRAPRPGTRDAVVVTFPRPIDHAVVMRALGIETKPGQAVGGTSAIEEHDTRWTFVPASAWSAGEYTLLALSYLEDPQGNQIGRPFEAIEDELKDAPAPDGFRVAFTIAP